MKKTFLLLFVLLLSSLFVISCNNDNKSTSSQVENYQDFSELDIPDNFNFETERNLSLKIYAPNKGTVTLVGNDDVEYYHFLTDDLNPIERRITLPKAVTSIDFRFRNMVFANYSISDLVNDPEVYLMHIYENEEKTTVNNKGVKLYVIPILEGIVMEDDGSITSHWGYNNQFSENYYQPIGSKNKFTGSGLNSSNYNQGQPTEFLPGRHYDVFTVNFTSIGNDCITWSLQSSNRLTQDACPNAPLFPGSDDDSDGVNDDDDVYPPDEDKSYDFFFPAEGTYGTLAFEDLWPDKGDYDFNDMVIQYNIKEVVNSANDLVEIHFNLLLTAIGASKQNGFFFELPIQAEDVTVTEASYPLLTRKINDSGLAIIQVFNNTNDIIQLNGDFMNTISTEQNRPYIPISFVVIVDGFYSATDHIYPAPYNPFITVNHNPAMEVHLPGLAPTPNADQSIFNNPNNDDATDIASGYYYKTAEGAPWAINVPYPMSHPLETIDIVKAYPDFGKWVNSNGQSYREWYKNRNAQLTHTPNE